MSQTGPSQISQGANAHPNANTNLNMPQPSTSTSTSNTSTSSHPTTTSTTSSTVAPPPPSTSSNPASTMPTSRDHSSKITPQPQPQPQPESQQSQSDPSGLGAKQDSTLPPSASASVSTSTTTTTSKQIETQREREREREREKERERIVEQERIKLKEIQRLKEEKEQKERDLALERNLQREHETRILWYSLPHHDQTEVYSDTDSSNSSGLSDLEPAKPNVRQPIYPPPSSLGLESAGGIATGNGNGEYIHLSKLENPEASNSRSTLDDRDGRMALRRNDSNFTNTTSSHAHSQSQSQSNASRPNKRIKHDVNKFSNHHLDTEEDDDDHDAYDGMDHDGDQDEDWLLEERKELYGNRSGNRGNKLRRSQGVRWIRRKKLGGFTEARNEKEMADRVRVRVASLQRAAIQSLLNSAPLPHPMTSLASNSHESSSSGEEEEEEELDLNSTTLAPSLLRPVITPRQLLASHTLKHTFRNPHIGALAKTALDLRESEGVVERAIGRCFAAMEWENKPMDQVDVKHWSAYGNGNGHGQRKRKKRKFNGDTDDDEDDDDGGAEAGNLDDGNMENQVGNPKGKENEGRSTMDENAVNDGNEGVEMGNGGDRSSGNPRDEMDVDHRLEDQDNSEVKHGLTDGHHHHHHHLQQQQEQERYSHQQIHGSIDADSSESASLSGVSCNPAFSRLEELFITPGGLPVPTMEDPDQSGSSDPNHAHAPHTLEPTTLLSVGNQRAIVKAALECLHELSSDSREYIERLQEVRNRLADVRRERSHTWQALRNWSLDREQTRLGMTNGRNGDGNGNGIGIGVGVGVGGNDVASGNEGHHHNHGGGGGKSERKKGTARTSNLANKRR